MSPSLWPAPGTIKLDLEASLIDFKIIIWPMLVETKVFPGYMRLWTIDGTRGLEERNDFWRFHRNMTVKCERESGDGNGSSPG